MSKSDGPIRLGLMAPFTGLVELYGPEIAWAGQVATEEINENGGVLGRPLELVIVDDGSLPDTAVPAANRLVDEEGCVAIIGNLLSNSRISVANMVAEPKKIPHLNFSFYEGSIWSRYFFSFSALPNQQIDKMIPCMADRFGPKMFFAGSNYEWPRGSIDAGIKSLREHGGEAVGESYLPLGTDTFDDLLDQVQASGADVFVPYFAGSDQTNLLTQFTKRGLKKHMAVVMGHYDEAMVRHLSAEVREGFYSSNTYFMSLDTPENTSYLARLASREDVTGIWPNGNGVLTNFGEGTYICVKAFAAAAEAAGSVEAEDLVRSLETISLKGPQGLVEMDPVTHHARVSTHLSCCRADGTFEIIQSFGALPPVIPPRYRKLFPLLRDEAAEGDGEEGPRKASSTIVPDKKAKAAVMKTDADGIIIEVNAETCEVFGYDAGEMVGLSLHLMLPPHLRDQHRIFFQRFIDSDRASITIGQQGAEVFGYRKNGSQFPARVGVTKAYHGGEVKLVATLFDISRQIESSERINRQATHDPLTGLINESLVKERLDSALKRTAAGHGQVHAVLFDIDGFGAMNEAHGFDFGDEVLIAVSKMLLKEAGPGDVVGRLGGDEFLVIHEAGASAGEMDDLIGRVGEGVRGMKVGGTISLAARFAAGNGATHSAEQMLDDLQG